MPRVLATTAAFVFASISIIPAQVHDSASPPPPHSVQADETAESGTKVKLMELRDAFIRRAAAAGFSCPIAPPTILLRPVASFGNYDPETNTLQTPAWEQLSEEEKGLFHRLAGPGADDVAAIHNFEMGTHHWVFIHEMGHWWQACTHANKDRQPYHIEYGANRIAAAYWREVDPQLMGNMDTGFQRLLKDVPNPVPEGQPAEKFFNDNYGEKLAKSHAYPWFQAQMIAAVNAEKPLPSFAEALRQVGN